MSLITFHGFKLPTKESINDIVSLGIKGLVIGLNAEITSATGFRYHFNPNRRGARTQLIETSKRVLDAGLSLEYLMFEYPSDVFAKEASDEICEVFYAIPEVTSLIKDQEGYWRKGFRKAGSKFKNYDELWPTGFGYKVTSFGVVPKEVESSINSDLVVAVIPQAYSAWLTGHLSWTQRLEYAPGTFQELAYNSYKKFGLPIQLALPNYSQTRPLTAYSKAMTSTEAMGIAFNKAKQLTKGEDIYIWDYKFFDLGRFSRSASIQDCKAKRDFILRLNEEL